MFAVIYTLCSIGRIRLQADFRCSCEGIDSSKVCCAGRSRPSQLLGQWLLLATLGVVLTKTQHGPYTAGASFAPVMNATASDIV